MADYKLKSITENSWILHLNGNKIAMLIYANGSYKAMGTLDRKSFTDLDDLASFLGGKVSIEEPEPEADMEVADVDGYPIKHSAAYDINLGAYPSYSKTANSTTKYAAGYYGVRFHHGWVSSYCPKTSTLDENNWIGPFRTRLEMLNAITQQKNAPRV